MWPASKSPRSAKRERGGPGGCKANASQGAQAYLKTRRAPQYTCAFVSIRTTRTIYVRSRESVRNGGAYDDMAEVDWKSTICPDRHKAGGTQGTARGCRHMPPRWPHLFGQLFGWLELTTHKKGFRGGAGNSPRINLEALTLSCFLHHPHPMAFTTKATGCRRSDRETRSG